MRAAQPSGADVYWRQGGHGDGVATCAVAPAPARIRRALRRITKGLAVIR
ncbi:MAG: hypothetical protein V8R40_03195 [Dysosmobacter sp.]